MHGGTALPEHDAVIIDEAHELVARVTGAASAELSPQAIERVARRVLSYLEDELALEFLESADLLRTALDETALERVEDPESSLILACREIVSVTRRVVSELAGPEEKADPERRQAGCCRQGALRHRRAVGGAVGLTTSSGWPIGTASGARRGWPRSRSPDCCGIGCSPTGRSC